MSPVWIQGCGLLLILMLHLNIWYIRLQYVNEYNHLCLYSRYFFLALIHDSVVTEQRVAWVGFAQRVSRFPIWRIISAE